MRLRLNQYEQAYCREKARQNNISYVGLINFLTDRHSDAFREDIFDVLEDDENIAYIKARYGECEDYIYAQDNDI